MSRSVSGRLRADAPPWRVGNPPLQGSSLESGLCCPGLSSLNRPHPTPLAGTSRLRRKAAYTQCLRCAGAPRRPASGSGLSLTIPAWHAALYDPGEFDHRYGPVLRCRHGLRRDLSSPALPILPQSVSRGARISGLPDSRICYGLPSCSLSCTDRTDTLGPRELLLPGFQQIGCPPRCWI